MNKDKMKKKQPQGKGMKKGKESKGRHWTDEEVAQLVEGVQLFGCKWSKIIAHYKMDRNAEGLMSKYTHLQSEIGKEQKRKRCEIEDEDTDEMEEEAQNWGKEMDSHLKVQRNVKSNKLPSKKRNALGELGPKKPRWTYEQETEFKRCHENGCDTMDDDPTYQEWLAEREGPGLDVVVSGSPPLITRTTTTTTRTTIDVSPPSSQEMPLVRKRRKRGGNPLPETVKKALIEQRNEEDQRIRKAVPAPGATPLELAAHQKELDCSEQEKISKVVKNLQEVKSNGSLYAQGMTDYTLAMNRVATSNERVADALQKQTEVYSALYAFLAKQ